MQFLTDRKTLWRCITHLPDPYSQFHLEYIPAPLCPMIRFCLVYHFQNYFRKRVNNFENSLVMPQAREGGIANLKQKSPDENFSVTSSKLIAMVMHLRLTSKFGCSHMSPVVSFGSLIFSTGHLGSTSFQKNEVSLLPRFRDLRISFVSASMFSNASPQTAFAEAIVETSMISPETLELFQMTVIDCQDISIQ